MNTLSFTSGVMVGFVLMACLMGSIHNLNRIHYIKEIEGLRATAVLRNQAEWTVDPKTGESTFKWK